MNTPTRRTLPLLLLAAIAGGCDFGIGEPSDANPPKQTEIKAHRDYLVSRESRRQLLIFRAAALGKAKRYAEALDAIEAVEAFESELEEQTDYGPVKESLRRVLGREQKQDEAPEVTAQADTTQMEAEPAAAEPLPETFALEAAYPNPFNPRATVPFALPEEA